jgi:hypothetical protein
MPAKVSCMYTSIHAHVLVVSPAMISGIAIQLRNDQLTSKPWSWLDVHTSGMSTVSILRTTPTTTHKYQQVPLLLIYRKPRQMTIPTVPDNLCHASTEPHAGRYSGTSLPPGRQLALKAIQTLVRQRPRRWLDGSQAAAAN